MPNTVLNNCKEIDAFRPEKTSELLSYNIQIQKTDKVWEFFLFEYQYLTDIIAK